MDRRRLVLFSGGVVVLVLLGYALFMFASEYGGSASGTLTASASSSTVTAGSSVTISATASNLSYSGTGYFCLSSYSRQSSATWCSGGGGSGCLTPCTWQDAFDGMESYGYWYQVMTCMSSSGCDFASFGGDDLATIYSTCNNGVWYFLGNSNTSPSSFNGFYLANGQGIDVYVDFHTRGISVDAPVIGLCSTGSGFGYTGPDSYSSSWTYLKDWYPTYKGISWHCVLWKYTGSSTTPEAHVRIIGSGSARFAIFMSGAETFDSTNCSSQYWTVSITGIKVIPESDQLGSTVRLSFVPQTSGVSCSPSSSTSPADTSSSYSASSTCSVSSTVSGTATVEVKWIDLGPMYFHAGTDSYYFTVVPQMVIATKDVSFSVQRPATTVSLSGVSQASDDSAVQGTVTVSGGTIFDYVKLYIDGSLVATVNKSSFSCGSSTCTYSFKYSMYGKSDGSHTVKAELYVDGSLTDTASASFSYYQLGIRSVSATQSSASFEDKGGYKYVQVYVDSTSCVAKSWTLHAPSSAHDWSADSVSYTWPSCATSQGTHTVYVQLKDASGHVVTSSSTVSVSYTYSLSNPQPSKGTRYYVQAPSKWTVPSSFSIPTSVSYSTDSPSVQIKEYFAGAEVASKTVSGSGTFSYTITSQQVGSGCGLGKVISWSMGSASAQTSVDIYCVYAKIVSPSGTVVLPTENNETVSSGSSVVVDVSVDSDPPGVTLTPTVTVDGKTGSQVSCSVPGDYCYRFDASGWSCGSSHTVSLSVSADGQSGVAKDSATFTVKCSSQYVDIVFPQSGSTVNIYKPVQDVQVPLSVDWYSEDSGASLKIWLNGSYRDLPVDSNCSARSCYFMTSADGLQLGSNEVHADLYGSDGKLLAEANSVFYVNYWSFQFGEDWDSSPPVFYVKDMGNPNHADYCTYELNDLNGYMNFNPSLLRWEIPLDKNYVGSVVNVSCYYGSTLVFEGNYTIRGETSQAQPASSLILSSGGPVSYTVTAYPVFPKYRSSGRYIYSVYTFSGAPASDVFKDVYISQGQLCFVPREGHHHIVYYRAGFTAFPTTPDGVAQIIGSLTPRDVVSVDVVQHGSAYCFPLKGTAAVLDEVDGGSVGKYYFLVLDTEQSTMGMNVAFVGVVAALLVGYILYQKGVFG